MNTTTVGRIQDQTLAQYIKTHPATDPGVLETVKRDIQEKLEYVKHTLYGEQGYDEGLARSIMDETRQGIKALYDSPIQGFQANAEAAQALIQQMVQEGRGKVGSQVIVLHPSQPPQESEGLAQPAGFRPSVELGPQDRVLSSTVTEGAEEPSLSDYAGQYQKLNQNRCYDKRTRPGLDATLDLANGVAPQVQGILVDRVLQRATVSRFHESEHASSVAHGGSQAHIRSDKDWGFGTHMSGSSSSSFGAVSSHDKEASGLSQPELIDALAGLQTLSDRIDTLTAYPGTTVNVLGRQDVSETANVERSFTPAQHLTRGQRLLKKVGVEPPAAEPELRPQTITVLDDSRTRKLGSLPFVPAYFDTPETR